MTAMVYVHCLQTRRIPCLCTNAIPLIVVIRSTPAQINNRAYFRKKLTNKTLSVYHWRDLVLFIRNR